jgi:hypothetical protein
MKSARRAECPDPSEPAALICQTLLDSGFRFPYAGPMFEMIAPQLTTAAEKLTHLRRFL